MSTDQPLAIPAQASQAEHGTLLALPAVADRLGVSVATVRRMLKRSALEGAHLQPSATGPQWVVPLASVESLLAKRKQSAQQAPLSIKASAPAAEAASELAQLRKQVADLQRMLETEQALARERAHQLEQLHETFRVAMLTAGAQAQPRAAEPQAQEGAGKRRWWQRNPNP